MKNTIYFNAEFAPLLLVNEEQVGSNSIVINIEADSTAGQSLLITMDSGTTTSLTVTPGQENSLAIDEAYWSLGGSTFVSLVKGGLTSNSITLIFPETINTDASLEETSNLTYTMTGSNTVTEQIDDLDDRVTALEQGGGGKEVYTSTADPSITDGSNDNVWFKYTLQAGLKFDNGTIYPDKWYYMGCFRGEYTGYGEGWCYVWANNYPIPQDVNTGEGYVFPFLEYNAGYRILKLGIRCHKDRYAQIVDTAAVTFYVVSKGYPTGRYFTGTWMYCDMDANYQQYFGINLQISLLLFGVALIVQQSEVSTTREYVAIDGVSTLTNIAKRTNAEWVKINGEWVIVSEDIGSEVVVTPTLTEGTEIGEIEVSGNSKKLYAPTTTVTPKTSTGTNIADISVDGTTYQLFAPSGGGGGSEVERWIDWDNKVDITLPYTATADGYFFFRIYQAKCQVTINGVNIISQAESDREVSGSGIYPISTGDVLKLDFGTAPGTMWFVPLKETGTGSSGHNYSTTEQVVGTWIDGKPVYEITYELATPLTINSTSYIHSGITPANIKSLIGMPEIIDVHGQSAPIVVGLYSNGEIALAALNTVYGIDLKYLIVRYTKTTD